MIDAGRIAREAGLAGRTNTVLQTCFFAISGVLERDEAIERIKASIAKTYGQRGAEVVERNQTAVDRALEGLHRVELPEQVTLRRASRRRSCPHDAPEFVRTVTAAMMAGHGDELPVSALPVDGTYPSGTTQYEKRNISDLVAVWDPELCIQCGNCSFVCPHSVIRSRYYEPSRLHGAPAGFRSAPLNAPGLPEHALHAAGLRRGLHRLRAVRRGLPGVGGQETRRARRSTSMQLEPLLRAERENIAFFERLPRNDRTRVDFGTVRGTQFLEPLFEFSGACAGCGETPYLKLALAAVRRPPDGRQRDRLLVDLRREPARPRHGRSTSTGAARRGRTRCSRTTPSSASGCGSPPTSHTELARRRLSASCAMRSARSWSTRSWTRRSCGSQSCAQQRERVAELERRLDGAATARAVADLRSVVDHLIRRSVWIVGGDGWAYDIGVGRPRSRAGQRAQRQRAGARHRGLLEHRRADVEGHAARGGGEVRRRRQDDAHQGSRAPGDRATPTCTSRGSRWAPIRSRR